MRESRYNVWLRDGERHAVFAGLSGQVNRLSHDEREAVAAYLAGSPVQARHAELIERLVVARVLVGDAVDETAILRTRYESGTRSPSVLGLTIVTSSGCNFDCPYCFEDKRPAVISGPVADAVVELVNRRRDGLELVNVCWYGGEPLMAKAELFALSARLREACERQGVHYQASIVTNGWLLDRSTASRLASEGVQHAQVTIDGPPDVHDVMRPHLNGRGTFDRVVANVAASADVLPIDIRVNLDRHNPGRVEELLDLLVGAGLAGRVSISAGHLVANDLNEAAPSASYRRSCLTHPQFADAELALKNAARRRGFAVDGLPGPATSPCTAVRGNDWIVGPEGQLWKCFDDVGFDEEIIGSIFAIDEPNDRLGKWLAHDPFSDEDCSSCIALPGCMGGCALYGRQAHLRDNRCSTFRHRYRETVADAIGFNRSPTAALAALATAEPVEALVTLGPTRRSRT